ncbi:hypothetical protein AB0L59_01220 [Streptomyces sp. NPDC052109]|uniref:hypothetical protein n=1 Tax=Streptomyces sp. NPDC052109 TaxID=3155527 RepID=UPI0034336C41
MPEDTESGYVRSGRLFAALAVLHYLVSSDRKPLDRGAYPSKDNILIRINRIKRDYSLDQLMALRNRGGQEWEAAAEIFRLIPGLLSPGRVPTEGLNDKSLAEHKAGYDAQMTDFREKFPKLLP